MSLPASWPLVHVTGRFVELDGTPCVGSVVFATPANLAGGDVLVPASDIELPLSEDGSVSGDVPASDYPDLAMPFAYTVNELLRGHPPRSYALHAPTGAALDLATAAPVYDAPAMNQFITGASRIVVVPTLPSNPDPSILYITTQ